MLGQYGLTRVLQHLHLIGELQRHEDAECRRPTAIPVQIRSIGDTAALS